MDFFHSLSFHSLVDELINQHHVPGLAVAVVQDDKIASASFGKASLDPSKPCTADTLFDIASSAKSLTAASVGLLVEDNENYPEVQYDAVMSTLLPDDFVMAGTEYTEGITVEDILAHRTGMPSHNDSLMSRRATQPDDARSITRNLRNLPVAAPLRARYLYCNIMYIVATYLVEMKSKQSFSDFLTKRIFQPLRMESTGLQPESARARGLDERLATGYHWDKESSTYHGFQSPDCPEGQGAGSIISSANDFILWVKALINKEQPINEKVYQGLVRLRSFPNPSARRLRAYTSPAMYAAGLEIYYYRGCAVIGHEGAISGFASRFFFLPDFRFGAVILGNSAGAGSVATILSRELIDEVIKIPEAELSQRRKGMMMQLVASGSPSSNPTEWLQGEAKSKGKSTAETKRRPKKEKPKVQQSSSSVQSSRPQETPLKAYIGTYWNAGYRELTVQIKNKKLFVDGNDRSTPFTLTLEHVADQTKYMAHLSDLYEGGDDLVEAEFIFEEDRVVKMGLRLENALKILIWFDKM